ncbi:hypothetical protein M427DRAFT_56290 [Gonapodya prolifera JEL478]|uniref:Uncharacterized protein n=1 Tax=Gonapodya prolifera (strain JEL478) TaxID=1344416 RepID=A0A139AHT5_GONPJ|nr:hypothetical protein M427DRAFT_56290 [Gonapodya prolifera JEL478]|eukprot:KXS15995.1 hypothetical protein M427DRAFT_56290 [Gonapodya prolifera JEL478]
MLTAAQDDSPSPANGSTPLVDGKHLSELRRPDLQALAKKHGIPANKKTSELVELLRIELKTTLVPSRDLPDSPIRANGSSNGFLIDDEGEDELDDVDDELGGGESDNEDEGKGDEPLEGEADEGDSENANGDGELAEYSGEMEDDGDVRMEEQNELNDNQENEPPAASLSRPHFEDDDEVVEHDELGRLIRGDDAKDDPGLLDEEEFPPAEEEPREPFDGSDGHDQRRVESPPEQLAEEENLTTPDRPLRSEDSEDLEQQALGQDDDFEIDDEDEAVPEKFLSLNSPTPLHTTRPLPHPPAHPIVPSNTNHPATLPPPTTHLIRRGLGSVIDILADEGVLNSWDEMRKLDVAAVRSAGVKLADAIKVVEVVKELFPTSPNTMDEASIEVLVKRIVDQKLAEVFGALGNGGEAKFKGKKIVPLSTAHHVHFENDAAVVSESGGVTCGPVTEKGIKGKKVAVASEKEKDGVTQKLKSGTAAQRAQPSATSTKPSVTSRPSGPSLPAFKPVAPALHKVPPKFQPSTGPSSATANPPPAKKPVPTPRITAGGGRPGAPSSAAAGGASVASKPGRATGHQAGGAVIGAAATAAEAAESRATAGTVQPKKVGVAAVHPAVSMLVRQSKASELRAAASGANVTKPSGVKSNLGAKTVTAGKVQGQVGGSSK